MRMQHKTIAALLLLTVTAVPAAAQCLHSFDAPRGLPFATTRPIAAADFDRDGRMDLLTADAVYLGFSKRVSVSPNAPTAHVRVNDVNGDGAADVVGVEGKDLVVLVNKGDATFIRKTTPFTTSHELPTFSWGDFNGDGVLDAFVSGSPVYLAAGDGTFERENGIVFNANGHWVVGDVTGDGRDDIVISDGGPSVILYRREGNGFTGDSVPQIQGGIPLLAADFDGDGSDDILTNRWILFDLGRSSLRRSEAFSGAISDHRVEALDFNGDGAIDLAATSSTTLVIFLNDGHGKLSVEQRLPGFASPPLIADVDGDGLLDLVTTERLHPVILHGHGDGTFREVPRVALASASIAGKTAAAGDLDGDGDDDIVFSNAVSWNNGDNTFNAVSMSDDRLERVLLAADIDGDGKAEVITTRFTFEAGQMQSFTFVLRIRPDGTVVEVARLNVYAEYAAVGDFGGANRPELAMLASTLGGFGSIQVFDLRSGTTPRFIAQRFEPTRSLAAADLNGDGADDLLLSGGTLFGNTVCCFPPDGSRDGFLSVFLSTGTSFEPERRREFPSAALHELVTGDFDGDGKTDVAATTMLVTPRMVAFFGDGKGTFARTQETPLDSSPVYRETVFLLRADDFNADGRTDVAVNGPRLFFGGPGGLTEDPAHYFGPLMTGLEESSPSPMLVRPRRGVLPSIIVPRPGGSDALIYRPFCLRPRPVRR
jgi:hypothetical protein